MVFLLSAFQSCWEFVGFFWWFLFVCFVLKVKHISICTLSSILTSSSSKRPVPPLKRPPLEPNGVKSSSVSLGGLKMSSSSSRKQERQEYWLSFRKGNKETAKTKISLIPPPLSYKHDMYREAAVDLSGRLWLLHNVTFKVKLSLDLFLDIFCTHTEPPRLVYIFSLKDVHWYPTQFLQQIPCFLKQYPTIQPMTEKQDRRKSYHLMEL